jgi:isochorismate synthase
LDTIFIKIEEALAQQRPFVSYRKPDSTLLNSLFLKTDTVFYSDEFTETGFVFAPFDSKEKAILFPLSEATFLSENLEKISVTISEENHDSFCNESQKEAHIQLVNKGIEAIEKTHLTKIVLSRKETISLDDLNILTTFKKLIHFYKNALVYIWYHPKIGLWLGATPETLLKSSNKNFETMSLAGTQPFIENKAVFWGNKELEEQQLVTDFIKNQLKSISEDVSISETETVKAGSLLHLKTKVTGNLKTGCNLKNIVRALHPTPAVCGFPRNEAKIFIQEKENYQRTFYTGFLGEINFETLQVSDKKSHLFVNLRCMEIHKNNATVFVGGGITKDSNAEKEWLETVAKSKTMKKVLS